MSSYLRQRDRGFVLGLLLAVCVVYLPFLGNPFVFDDANLVQGQVSGHDTHSLLTFDLRWLPYATFGWTYAVFSDEFTHFYHLGNLLLHAANVITLFYLLRHVAGAVTQSDSKQAAVLWGAWFGALIFAVHPVAVYAVGYVIERTILMATLFALLMQLAYLRGLLTGRVRWFVLAVAAYFLACFSKEHAVMMPAVLAALTILMRGKNKASLRALWLTWMSLVAIGLLVVWRVKGLGVVGGLYEMGKDSLISAPVTASTSMMHVYSVLTQAGLFFKYLLLWVIPNPAWMSIDMREHFVSSLTEWQGWLGAVAFLAYGGLGLWLLFRRHWAGLAGLALLYPWLQFVLEFSTIRVQEIFVLYRTYLWFPGMMFFFPLLLSKWPGKKAVLVAVLVPLLLLPLALNRLWVFADDYRLWNEAAKLLHGSHGEDTDRIYYMRARAEAYVRNWPAAAEDYERVVNHRPNMPVLRYGLGVVYYNLGRYQDALEQFDAATKLDPAYAIAYFNKALTLKTLHQDGLALEQMKKACELKYPLACIVLKWPTRQ